MLKKVKLYGELAERYGKDWSLDINSPKEAVRALIANNPDFAQFVGTSQDRGVGYKINVGGTYLKDPINEIHNPSGKQEIKIIPVVLGAKNRDAVELIIIGGLLIWGGWALKGWAAKAALAGTASNAMVATAMYTGKAAMYVGAQLAIGGTGTLLAGTPQDKDEVDNYAFSGPVNNTRQGLPVPICYGQLLVGSSVISSGITAGAY